MGEAVVLENSADEGFWTPARVRKLLMLKRRGWSMGEIALFLGCTKNTVLGRLFRERRALVEKVVTPRLSTPRPMSQRTDAGPAIAESRQAPQPSRPRYRPEEASIWHLVDLKRAGHSPTRTELRIIDDAGPTRLYLAPGRAP